MDLSSKKFTVNTILKNVAKNRSLRYNSYKSKPHWTMQIALQMKKKLSRADYEVWIKKYMMELDAKRRQETR
tara:strand:- start:1385 stop:1600 length:216 start_codon:yes stop_codon:yes gene_type:complete